MEAADQAGNTTVYGRADTPLQNGSSILIKLTVGADETLPLDAGFGRRIFAGWRSRLRETTGVCVHKRYQRVRWRTLRRRPKWWRKADQSAWRNCAPGRWCWQVHKSMRSCMTVALVTLVSSPMTPAPNITSSWTPTLHIDCKPCDISQTKDGLPMTIVRGRRRGFHTSCMFTAKKRLLRE